MPCLDSCEPWSASERRGQAEPIAAVVDFRGNLTDHGMWNQCYNRPLRNEVDVRSPVFDVKQLCIAGQSKWTHLGADNVLKLHALARQPSACSGGGKLHSGNHPIRSGRRNCQPGDSFGANVVIKSTSRAEHPKGSAEMHRSRSVYVSVLASVFSLRFQRIPA